MIQKAATTARTANYAANQAYDSARRAVASANSAQTSAAKAKAASIHAGQDASSYASTWLGTLSLVAMGLGAVSLVTGPGAAGILGGGS
ncbi:hypothetical protein ACFVFQ_12375 [Streptomyces sp. NPDC057743]|uniref:hypothetical protein n=1 Tax=Streptomyces sp. NPDC057743 TaxID=3346236 RepID=UPI0036A3C4AB